MPRAEQDRELAWGGQSQSRDVEDRAQERDQERLAAAAFGVAAALGAALPAGVGRALLVALVGSVLYVVGLRFTAPRQISVLLGARRASST